MAATDDLLRVVRLLVDDPRSVRIEARERSDGATELRLSLPAAERGKVIGRHGRTIEALRALLAARGESENRRYAVELAEED